MRDYFSILTNIKELLDEIEGIKSNELGLEEGISYAQVPFIRVVAGDIEANPEYVKKENFYFSIYLGTAIKKELKDVYQEHFDFISKIREKTTFKQIDGGFIKFKEVKTDQDSLKNVKLSIIEFVIEGLYCAN